jgi:ArsR family transcriptional regulator
VSAYYRFDEAQLDPAQRALWHALSNGSDDPLLRRDAERVAAVLAHRASDQNWADSVAATWSATTLRAAPGRPGAHRVAAAGTGDVLDIASGDGVLAELVAPHAKRYICIDTSARGRRRQRAPAPPAQCGSARGRHACAARSRTAASTWWC